jgi:hypothetical protein
MKRKERKERGKEESKKERMGRRKNERKGLEGETVRGNQREKEEVSADEKLPYKAWLAC